MILIPHASIEPSHSSNNSGRGINGCYDRLAIEMHSPRRKPVNGYPSLAAFIASDKDQSASIYRSYYRLTSRNLLYLEAELFELERQQDELDEKDLKGDLKAKEYVRDWEMLSSDNDPRCIERRRLLANIRAKIKEYRKCDGTFYFPQTKPQLLHYYKINLPNQFSSGRIFLPKVKSFAHKFQTHRGRSHLTRKRAEDA